MKRSVFTYAFVAAWLVIHSLPVTANVRLPAVISDGMVLQQQEAMIWGWARPGERVQVTGSWNKRTVTARADKKGRWKLFLETADPGGPYSLSVEGNNKVVVNDICIGEVWICSGQSNMVFALRNSKGGKEEAASANFPRIRYFSVNRQYGPQESEDAPGSVWQVCDTASAGRFSAVAYHFAKQLHERLNIPVGIVYAAWGGTPAEAWMPKADFSKDSVLHRYLDRWKFIQKNAAPDSIKYYEDLASWRRDSAAGDNQLRKKPEEPQTLYYFRRPWREPTVLYNGMINPVVPFAARGVLWYQGESNVGYADEYEYLLKKMIHSWRQQWRDAGWRSSLSFYIVQLAAYGYSDPLAAARVREAQRVVAASVQHSGLAVTLDLGDMKDIHFTRKKEIGERLARIAFHKDYGMDTVQYQGPAPASASVTDSCIYIPLLNGPAKSRSPYPQGFEVGYKVAGSDSIEYKPADAVWQHHGISIRREPGRVAVVVRYGWLLQADASISNSNDLPASPFIIKLN